MRLQYDQPAFITPGVFVRAVVTSVLLALLIVGGGCSILTYQQRGQTPNGLGG